MDQAKANRLMLKRLLLAVAVMFGFTYGLVALYGKVSDEMGGAHERIAAQPANGRQAAPPGPSRQAPVALRR
jgi:cytochrome c oxidase assembly protein Cox11